MVKKSRKLSTKSGKTELSHSQYWHYIRPWDAGWFIIVFIFCRYASLFFCVAIERTDNELLTLEIIHRYVEILDKYFGNVSVPALLPFKSVFSRMW